MGRPAQDGDAFGGYGAVGYIEKTRSRPGARGAPGGREQFAAAKSRRSLGDREGTDGECGRQPRSQSAANDLVRN